MCGCANSTGVIYDTATQTCIFDSKWIANTNGRGRRLLNEVPDNHVDKLNDLKKLRDMDSKLIKQMIEDTQEIKARAKQLESVREEDMRTMKEVLHLHTQTFAL
eukprot:COSAG05_NODE_3526_length_2009_cov_18.687958_3_plen_104_part_00